MARRPFLTSLAAMDGEFMPAGSKGNELMKPDCGLEEASVARQRGHSTAACTRLRRSGLLSAYALAVWSEGPPDEHVWWQRDGRHAT